LANAHVATGRHNNASNMLFLINNLSLRIKSILSTTVEHKSLPSHHIGVIDRPHRVSSGPFQLGQS